MNATRVFKNVSMKKKDQDQQYEGDVFEMITAIARYGIENTSNTGRITDFSEMLIQYLNDDQTGITRHTSVSFLYLIKG